MKHYLGIDIGGTAVKLGIVDEAGAVLAKAEESVSSVSYTHLDVYKRQAVDIPHRRLGQ